MLSPFPSPSLEEDGDGEKERGEEAVGERVVEGEGEEVRAVTMLRFNCTYTCVCGLVVFV